MLVMRRCVLLPLKYPALTIIPFIHDGSLLFVEHHYSLSTSFQTDEENIALARPYIERARKYGIAVEVELGRLEGGEAGLRMISDAKLTNQKNADMFMKGCV